MAKALAVAGALLDGMIGLASDKPTNLGITNKWQNRNAADRK